LRGLLVPSGSAPVLRLGTRGSPLALAQAHQVQARLAAALAVDAGAIELKIIKTTGDAIQNRPLTEIGGKGLFVKEIEQALIDGAIDFAVHSAKDVPGVLPDGLVLAACLPREDARDAFISRRAASFAALAPGAVVGTASPRRQAMVKRLRGDLTVVPLRGNVETRLKKLAAGEVDATLLAMAGLNRLGLAAAATAPLDVDDFLPAVGQGVIALEMRADDARTRAHVAKINDTAAATALAAERAFLAVLDGSCRTPIAGHARLAGDTLHFRGLIVKPDGRESFETERRGHTVDAAALGEDAGRELRERAGADFFVV
jgi:hydroxymethylbilane synthase